MKKIKKINENDVRKALSKSKKEFLPETSKEFGIAWLNWKVSRKNIEKAIKKQEFTMEILADYYKECKSLESLIKKKKDILMKENPNFTDEKMKSITSDLNDNIKWCEVNITINDESNKLKTNFEQYSKGKVNK